MPSRPPSPLASTSSSMKSGTNEAVEGSVAKTRMRPSFSRTNQREPSAGSFSIATGCSNDSSGNTRLTAMAAVLAAVWLHGRAGELGAARLGEKSLIATDLLNDLPEAIRDSRNLANGD